MEEAGVVLPAGSAAFLIGVDFGKWGIFLRKRSRACQWMRRMILRERRGYLIAYHARSEAVRGRASPRMEERRDGFPSVRLSMWTTHLS